MLPLVIPLVATWQRGFVAWSVPVVAIALLVLVLAPGRVSNGAAKPRWWPDWNSPLIWRLGIMLGTCNAMYFCANGFLPPYLASFGQSEWIGPSLTALNVGQLPASFLLLAFASRLELRAWPYVACGLLCILAVAGMVFAPGAWVVGFAALLGFSNAAVLILALALPPLLASPQDLPRVTAAMFTVSYSCAVIVPVLSGLCWDLTGLPAMAFAPLAACGMILIVLAPAVLHIEPQRG